MPIISDCNQVTLEGVTAGGRPWAIVQHWIGLGGAPPDAENGAQFWAQSFVDQVLPGLCHDTSVTGGSYVDLSSSSGASGALSPLTGPLTGGDSGFMAPPNVCILVKCVATGTRSQRSGRMYLPGVNEDQIQANGVLTDDYRDDTQDAISSFLDALQDAFIAPVVNSKASETTYIPRTITAMSVQGVVATQRRRLRK